MSQKRLCDFDAFSRVFPSWPVNLNFLEERPIGILVTTPRLDSDPGSVTAIVAVAQNALHESRTETY